MAPTGTDATMVLRPADNKTVSLAELRFKPANSNDAARAVLSHQFANVPRCSFAGDDGISPYLASETLLASCPSPPGNEPALHGDIPSIAIETQAPSTGLRRKLLRGGFGLSVFLHAFAAVAIGYTTLALPDEDALLEGVTSVSIVVEGNADADETASGDVEETEPPEVEPEPKAVETEKPIPVAETPKIETAENILKQVPLTALGADLPEILVARQPAESKVETVATLPAEEKIDPLPLEPEITVATPPVDRPETSIEVKKEVPEPAKNAAQPLAHPVSKPIVRKKLVERKAEKKPEAVAKKPVKKVTDKPKPRQKVSDRKTAKGSQGDRANNARKGEADARKKGDQASQNSSGASRNNERGNASRSNYKGLVEKKLSRAKGRIRSPGKGKVIVRFTITAGGAATGIAIVRSSGKAAVDAAAIKVVGSASPFPAIPAEIGRKNIKMSMTIDFTGR
jgi:protein TonB